jgi:hypothetical protein
LTPPSPPQPIPLSLARHATGGTHRHSSDRDAIRPENSTQGSVPPGPAPIHRLGHEGATRTARPPPSAAWAFPDSFLQRRHGGREAPTVLGLGEEGRPQVALGESDGGSGGVHTHEHQLMDMIKDDMLMLGSYLRERLRENEPDMQPELWE